MITTLPSRITFPEWKTNLVRQHFGLPPLGMLEVSRYLVFSFTTKLTVQEETNSSRDLTEESASAGDQPLPVTEGQGDPSSATSLAALVEEETSSHTSMEDLAVEEEEDPSPGVSVSVLLADMKEDEEEEDKSPGISVSVLLADQEEEEEEEVLAESPEVEGSPPLREELSLPAPEHMEAAGGEIVVDVDDKESKGTQQDEKQQSISIEKFVNSLLEEILDQCVQTPLTQTQNPGPGPDNIIDITDDSEDEQEVFPEISVSREPETGGGEDKDRTKQLVETIIDDLIQSVVEQDPEVIIEGILDEIIGGAVARAKEKKPKYLFGSEDIRYKKKSTTSEDFADQQCGLSLLLLPWASPSGRSGAEERPDQEMRRFISSMNRRKQISEKTSEPKDFMRVDYLFKSSGDRAKFQEKALEVSKGFQGLKVHMIVATEKELGSKEKPILSEDEIMWIYSEANTKNLFKEFAVEVTKEGSSSSSRVKFKFAKENIQLNKFLACNLLPEKAFLGKVRKEAKVTLPLRMTSQEKNGKIVFPVEVAGAGVSENLLRQQEGKFGFKIFKIIKETQSIQMDFQTSFQFYKFWTSKFSRKLNKVKFTQVTLNTDT